MFPIIPVALGLGVLGAWWKVSHTPKEPLNKTSQDLFDAAMTSLTDPTKLRLFAATFQSAGFLPQAAMLNQRANLFSLPADVQATNSALFQKAAGSQNVAGILEAAKHFESLSAFGAAKELRAIVDGLNMLSTLQAPISAEPSAVVPAGAGHAPPTAPEAHTAPPITTTPPTSSVTNPHEPEAVPAPHAVEEAAQKAAPAVASVVSKVLPAAESLLGSSGGASGAVSAVEGALGGLL
jgi:hypothetical protein